MKKKITKIKSYLPLIIFLALFIAFLLSIPTLVNDENNNSIFDEKIKTSGESSEIIEQTKFEQITQSTLQKLEKTQIEDLIGTNQYLDYLISPESQVKIKNRENTVAQEIVTLYINNHTKEAKSLMQSILIEELDKYDSEIDRRWRNHLIYIQYENESYILYNQTNVLRDLTEAKIFGHHKIDVKLYDKQKYYFKTGDQKVDIVTVDLNTGNGTEELENYKDITDFMTEYEYDNNNIYTIHFYIWK